MDAMDLIARAVILAAVPLAYMSDHAHLRILTAIRRGGDVAEAVLLAMNRAGPHMLRGANAIEAVRVAVVAVSATRVLAAAILPEEVQTLARRTQQRALGLLNDMAPARLGLGLLAPRPGRKDPTPTRTSADLSSPRRQPPPPQGCQQVPAMSRSN